MSYSYLYSHSPQIVLAYLQKSEWMEGTEWGWEGNEETRNQIADSIAKLDLLVRQFCQTRFINSRQ